MHESAHEKDKQRVSTKDWPAHRKSQHTISRQEGPADRISTQDRPAERESPYRKS